MTLAHRLAAALAVTFLTAAASAAPTIDTSSADFLARLAPGAYTENFDGLSSTPSGPFAFSGGAFSYTISAPSDTYASGEFIGASQIDEALTITFTSGNVRAVGANFFFTNISDAFQAVMVTLSLSDGTVESFTPTSLADSYRGFVSDSAITSLVLTGSARSLYASLDNLTVGSLPEPASIALVGLALAGIAATRRRRSL